MYCTLGTHFYRRLRTLLNTLYISISLYTVYEFYVSIDVRFERFIWERSNWRRGGGGLATHHPLQTLLKALRRLGGAEQVREAGRGVKVAGLGGREAVAGCGWGFWERALRAGGRQWPATA